ncbi:MAG: ribonuclease domain-containing protein [Lysobacter sp.]
MNRARPLWLLAAVVLIGLWAWSQQDRDRTPDAALPAITTADHSVPSTATPFPPTAPADRTPRYPDFLPREAHAVLDAIDRGGPHDHRQDGSVFQNRERRLPPQSRGYYREYTVATPGSDDRGPRRIVTGGGVPGAEPPHEYWYSEDHYRSFRRFDVDRGAAR